MSQTLLRLLPLLAAFVVYPGGISAQQPNRLPPLLQGDAVVTGFSGTAAPDPTRLRALNRPPIDLTFIDPSGPSMRVMDVSSPGFIWDGRFVQTSKTFDVAAKDVGQVFGVALDDEPSPNIYVAATSAFGLHLVARGNDGQPERRKKGGAGVGWMAGQFGLDLQGGPGSIYKIDGQTGAVTLFANVTLDGASNPGPGLGNLAYDAAHKQLLVSDLYTGMVHRFGPDGRDLGVPFDHGVAGLTAAKQLSQPFNPRNRPNIATDRFDAENPTTWGYAPPARRVWGLAVHQSRLYYSVAAGPQIWSVGIAQDGSFAADPRWELDVPAQSGPLPVSDIAFSHRGTMILAQRAPIAGAYDYAAFTRPGEPKVLRFWLKGPGDPPSPSRWKAAPEEYAVGFAGTYRNTNGGVALGYGYDPQGKFNIAACEASLWTTAQNIRNAPPLRDRLDPGGPLVVHGLQGSPSSPVRNFNEPPWTSYSVDYDGTFDDPRATGHLGSVRIYTKPCDAPAARYRGPGSKSNPPYVDPPTVTTECTGSTCPPPDCVFGVNCPPTTTIDLGIGKIGENNPNNPYGPYNFTIGVRNLGDAINTAQTITVTDVVPAGMTFTNVISANWTCTPNPIIPSGGTLTCTYTGSFPIASNQLLGTIDIVATGGEGPFENCASLAPGDKDPSNDKACVTVQKVVVLIVKKVVHSAIPLAGPYPVTVTCGSNVTNLSLMDGVPQTIGNIPFGTQCQVAETGAPPFPSGVCPEGKTPGWATTYAPSQPVTLNQDTTTVTVDNQFQCTGGGDTYVLVSKTIKNNSGLPLSTFSTMVFPITVTCNGVDYPRNVPFGTPQGVTGLASGITCNANETGPMPALPTTGCAIAGEVPTWVMPPNYLPASVLTPNGGMGPTLTVENTIECKPADKDTTSLTVTKHVTNRTDPQLSVAGLTYTGSVSCVLGSSPPGGGPFSLSDGGSQTFNNLAIGATCTVQENPPPPPTITVISCRNPGDVPTWTTSTPTTVLLGSSPTVVTIENFLDCKPSGQILVKKQVISAKPVPLTAANYPVTVTCGSQVTNLSLSSNGTPQSVGGISMPGSCLVTEDTSVLPNVCPDGTTANWSSPSISPNPVPVSPGPIVTVTVTNTVDCVKRVGKPPPPPSCDTGTTIRRGDTCACRFEGMVRVSAASCSCPAGMNLVPGRGCVRPVDCKPPMVPGAAPGVCACPPGTERKGRDCVRPQAECTPPAKRTKRGACECPANMIVSGNGCVPRERRKIPDDVIKNIPGGFGPGGGGREGPRGGGGGSVSPGGGAGGGYVPPGGGNKGNPGGAVR